MNDKQQQLFQEHQEWAERIGLSLHERLGQMNSCDADDFRQLALMGLLDAIAKYKPARGAFKHYAMKRIKGYVRDELRRCDEVGRSQRDRGQRGPVLSLEHPLMSSDGDRVVVLRNMLVSPKRYDQVSAWDSVRTLMYGLSDRKRALVYLVDVAGLAFWQAAAVLDVPEHLARSQHHQAIAFLRGRRGLLAGGGMQLSAAPVAAASNG